MRAFIKDNNLKSADDAQKALKELFKNTIPEMLEGELDTELGYEKGE
ncbi:MAG: IS256 family transposase, partial [Clostridiaceae bacterium]|nr:IS256 family transposase [Clostridiaceae bacterium]